MSDGWFLAALLAAIAASSLLLGAALGLFINAPQKVIAAVMAFGSGALIQALAVELAFGGAERLVSEHRMSQLESWLWVAGGFVVGGAIYYEANRWIEKRGGHLRKPARMKAHLFQRYAHLPHALSHLGSLHLPHFRHGGSPAEGTASAAAANRAMEAMPAAAEGRSLTPEVSMYSHGAEEAMREEHEEHGGAPVAIFLGALLDGIPESIVIGASFTTLAALSPTFLVAVFLSNLPEAMSSAAGMKRAGFSQLRIFSLWGSLVLASAVAAALGNAFLAQASPTLITLVEAIAGGGILAMLSSTMMPEAFEHGGPSVGLSTIAGFLAAFYFTTIELATKLPALP